MSVFGTAEGECLIKKAHSLRMTEIFLHLAGHYRTNKEAHMDAKKLKEEAQAEMDAKKTEYIKGVFKEKLRQIKHCEDNVMRANERLLQAKEDLWSFEKAVDKGEVEIPETVNSATITMHYSPRYLTAGLLRNGNSPWGDDNK